MFIAALSSELSEKMAIGGKLTLMGILIVFGLLALIVVILTIMERIMRKSGEKPKKERKNLKELFKNKMQKNEPKPETTVTPGAKPKRNFRAFHPKSLRRSLRQSLPVWAKNARVQTRNLSSEISKS